MLKKIKIQGKYIYEIHQKGDRQMAIQTLQKLNFAKKHLKNLDKYSGQKKCINQYWQIFLLKERQKQRSSFSSIVLFGLNHYYLGNSKQIFEWLNNYFQMKAYIKQQNASSCDWENVLGRACSFRFTNISILCIQIKMINAYRQHQRQRIFIQKRIQLDQTFIFSGKHKGFAAFGKQKCIFMEIIRLYLIPYDIILKFIVKSSQLCIYLTSNSKDYPRDYPSAAIYSIVICQYLQSILIEMLTEEPMPYSEPEQGFVINVWPEQYRKENLSDLWIRLYSNLSSSFEDSIENYLKDTAETQNSEPILPQSQFIIDSDSNSLSINKNDNNSASTSTRAFNNSPFHNFQKHLNSALKKLVKLPAWPQDEEVPKYIKVAHEIWQKFISRPFQTRKVLHYIFNQNNEHSINPFELQKYGLRRLYQSCDRSTLNLAKNYLTDIAVCQLEEGKIDAFLGKSKLKNPASFKKYMLEFRAELENRYLKRRSIKMLQAP